MGITKRHTNSGTDTVDNLAVIVLHGCPTEEADLSMRSAKDNDFIPPHLRLEKIAEIMGTIAMRVCSEEHQQ